MYQAWLHILQPSLQQNARGVFDAFFVVFIYIYQLGTKGCAQKAELLVHLYLTQFSVMPAK